MCLKFEKRFERFRRREKEGGVGCFARQTSRKRGEDNRHPIRRLELILHSRDSVCEKILFSTDVDATISPESVNARAERLIRRQRILISLCENVLESCDDSANSLFLSRRALDARFRELLNIRSTSIRVSFGFKRGDYKFSSKAGNFY